MKQFIIRTFLAALFLVAFYPLCLLLWGEYVSDELQKNLWPFESELLRVELDQLREARDVDILFVGSSHCAGGFDPRIFREAGFDNTYNMGTGGQCPVNTEALLDVYLEQLNPKLVIYEVFPRTFCDDGVESFVKLTINSAFGNDTLKVARSQNNLMIYNSLLYKYLRRDILRMPEMVKIEPHNLEYVQDGFYETYQTVTREYEFLEQTWKFKDYQKKAFSRIINKFKSKDIDYILVQAPLSKAYYNSFLNNDEIDNYFLEYGEYLNYNKMLDLDDKKDFYDAHHINQNGVVVFNKVLLDYIKLRKNSKS